MKKQELFISFPFPTIYTLLLQISIGRKLLFFWRNFLPQNLQPLNLFWQTSSLTGTGEAASSSKEFLSGADQPLLTETTETTKLKPQELQILEKEGGNSNLSLSRILGGQGGSAQRVGFFSIGSGRVLDKIPGSGSGSGRVGVSKNTIGYFRVSFFLSGISGYFGYFRVCRVFLGISGFTHIY